MYETETSEWFLLEINYRWDYWTGYAYKANNGGKLWEKTDTQQLYGWELGFILSV